MDTRVLQAMAKWPNVPECFGWLRLDARGRWHIPSGIIEHPGMIAFIGRNYSHDIRGRWYFQNGPQRVFVDLDYTPWIYRLRRTGIEDHTGQPIQNLQNVYLDDMGAVLLQAEQGLGALDDRDLFDLPYHEATDSRPGAVTLLQRSWPLQAITRQQVVIQGHFVPEPRN
jgi:Protein of unknown function (DUF2946)